MTQTTTTPSINRDRFLNNILENRPPVPVEQLDPETGEWLQTIREQSASWVSKLTLPTTKDEEWRFTDISSLLDREFVAPKSFTTDKNITIPEAEDTRLVFVNGSYAAELSNISGLPQGIYVGSLTNLPENFCQYFRPFLGTLPGKEEVFTSLNTASIADVAIIWAAPNTVVEKPIHLVFVSVAGESITISQPRGWIVAEKNCQLTIVEEYSGASSYITNAVTEIWLGENAQINHTRLQQESVTAYHIGKTAVNQKQDSRYTLTEINVGGQISRHSPEIHQAGAQTETNLNGLTIAKEEQTSDTHSVINLNHPHGTTDQLHKTIVSDRAHAIFNGKVSVPKPAQLTNASQLNRNLLLSPKARVNTKPELQITADNVKCSHGATVSQLEADEVFYLRSRGLTENDARQLLIDAFVNEIIERVPIKSMQQKIQSSILT
ncbi:FeS assembly protein SufD [Xenococcus sp. PCC 7305]|uniref:Fe-S cluster assembly protein SufD n=1 Tax=Xenococcus sp. PCC 7305 TaxID=102125 RepID=UPI0002ACFD10|nr:Fe-S cluster assembly protein SufD [Xenococcus sp. PCC 7305]ELS03801.1 FeS assembly protein SufD [Xenococcus sp. PCC 7305]